MGYDSEGMSYKHSDAPESDRSRAAPGACVGGRADPAARWPEGHKLIRGRPSPGRMVDEAPPFGRRLRRWLRAQRFPLSILVFLVGILLTILAVGYFTPLSQYAPFTSINPATAQPSANYNLVFVIAGPIVVIIGAYLVGAYYLARHRFEHLMETRSKAEFLRNLPEVEDLLWELTPSDEDRYARKKAEMGIRR